MLNRETLRTVLNELPDTYCWFPEGILCWEGKNPSRLPGCPGERQKGEPGMPGASSSGVKIKEK